jgi:asparagine synthase (glutamine-hydrolysing)
MSGIAGVVQFDGAPVMPGLVEKMCAAMAHRGPDRTCYWVKGSVAVGQCMLCTTPESLAETQPLASEDESLVLVMDGRVDNREELRQELAGHGARLRDRSDAELVLRAYEVWGEACADHIIGEFVFFLWDARERNLFAARDAAGVRHFYYHEGKGWFGFASEIKGLLASGRIEAKLNDSRVLDYLVSAMDRDDEVNTFYQGIVRLPAGHCLTASSRGVRTWRYWDPAGRPELKVKNLDECAEGLLEQLRVAVKCRLRSCAPVGSMLSGGLDSSSIVCLIREEFRQELQAPLKTFSLVRADREKCSEWPHVQEIVRGGWIEPHIISSDMPDEVCAAYFGRFKDPDEPFCWSHGLPYHLVYDAARASGCRVLLEGLCGDLLFLGAGTAMSMLVERLMLGRIVEELRAYRRYGSKGGIRSAGWSFLATFAPRWTRPVYRAVRSRLPIRDQSYVLLHPEVADRARALQRSRRSNQAAEGRPRDQRQVHARMFKSGLISFAHEVYGQMAASMGVEMRGPFSDRRVIEFAVNMPLEAKLYAPQYKFLLRRSMEGILPEPVRWRQNVAGHPGWTFYRRLLSRAKDKLPGWQGYPRALEPWVDEKALDELRRKYYDKEDYEAGLEVLRTAILAEWLRPRFGGALNTEEAVCNNELSRQAICQA